jgi:hypothetical protein
MIPLLFGPHLPLDRVHCVLPLRPLHSKRTIDFSMHLQAIVSPYFIGALVSRRRSFSKHWHSFCTSFTRETKFTCSFALPLSFFFRAGGYLGIRKYIPPPLFIFCRYKPASPGEFERRLLSFHQVSACFFPDMNLVDIPNSM